MGIVSTIKSKVQNVVNKVTGKSTTPTATSNSSTSTSVGFGKPTSSSPSGTYFGSTGGVSYVAPKGSSGAAVTQISSAASKSSGGSKISSGGSSTTKTANNAEILGSSDVAVGQIQPQTTNQLTPNSITPAKDVQYQNMGYLKATGLAFSTLGSNIAYNVGAAFDSNKDYKWNSVLGPYKYTGYGGQFVETNPFLTGSTSIIKPGTVSPGESPYYSKKEFAEQFMTTYKTTPAGLEITGPNLESSKVTRAERFASGTSAIGKDILQTLPAVGPIAIARDPSSFKTTIDLVRDKSGNIVGYSSSERYTPKATLNLGLSAINTIGIVPGTLKAMEFGQVRASSEYLSSLSKKTPYTGERTFEENLIKDVYGKTIKTDSGLLTSRGISYTATSDDMFKQIGALSSKQEITGYWTGNIYKTTEFKNIFSSGKILPEIGQGINPSIAKTYEFTPLKTSSIIGGKSNNINIYFETKPKSYFTAGRANQQTFPGYILAEGGKMKNLKIDTGLKLSKIEQGPAFSGYGNTLELQKVKTFKADIPLGNRVILKLKPEKGKVLDFGIAGGLPAQPPSKTVSLSTTPTTILPTSDLVSTKTTFPGASTSNIFKSTSTQLTKTTTILPLVSTTSSNILNTKQMTTPITTTISLAGLSQSSSKLVAPIVSTSVTTLPVSSSKTLIASAPSIVTGGSFTSLFPVGIIPGAFIPGVPSFDFSPSKVGKYGAKGRRKYTPDYSALIFGKKGKAPKGIAGTALGARPITKGFKWEFGRVKL